MPFPPFSIPFLGTGMTIGLNAILHVLISHGIAIGVVGMIVLIERYGHRQEREDGGSVPAAAEWEQFSHRLIRLSAIVISTVGAVTGVGIWFLTSVLAPRSIGSMLRIFFWPWFIEWGVFVGELLVLLTFYYLWDRLRTQRKNWHARLSGAYLALAVFSAVLIAGILGFMMTSDGWPWGGRFTEAFFNPTFIPQLLLRFSVPAIVGMMAQAVYNLVDRIFVGQAVGQKGIAGTTVAFPFMLILLAFSMLVGFGAASVVSLRLGEQKKDEAERVLGNAAVMLVGLSAAITAIALIFLDPLLVLFGASEIILPYAHDYLQIIVLGTLFQVAGFGLNAVIRGEGNPKIAMLTLLIGVTLNVVLAPVFIFGFGWGMKGAALATVISQGVSMTWVVAYFLSGKSLLRFRRKNFRPEVRLCATILAIGSPPFAMQMAASVMNSLLNNQLQSYGGNLAISVMGVIYAVVMMIGMPIFGLNQGAQPIIGYNYGAGKFDRVKKTLQTAMLAATAIVLAGYLVMMLFPQRVVALFDPHDDALIALGTHAMRICVLMLPLIGFQIVSASYFQAVGKPKQAMFLMLSRQLLLLIPAVLILPHFFGLDGVWAALPTADLGSSVLTAVWLLPELRHLHEKHVEGMMVS